MSYPAMTDVEKSIFSATAFGTPTLETPWTGSPYDNSIDAFAVSSALSEAYAAVDVLRANASVFVTLQGADTDGRGAYLADLVTLP